MDGNHRLAGLAARRRRGLAAPLTEVRAFRLQVTAERQRI
jgi:hypothetical protein